MVPDLGQRMLLARRLIEVGVSFVTVYYGGWDNHTKIFETFRGDELVGGLYGVSLGGAFFGESMFSRASDASKIALCALVALCRAQGITQIDCQQNTAHLASLGAAEMPRRAFCSHVALAAQRPAPTWQFEPLYWEHILEEPRDAS